MISPPKRIHLGCVSFERLPRPSRLVHPETDGRPYLSALEELGRLLVPDSWALAGGLVIPIAVGRFYRRHSDIDIVLPLSGISEVAAAFCANGYGLYTSWSASHGARGVLMEVRIKSDGRLLRLRPRRLYVKRFTPAPAALLLNKIDLYPYRIRGDRIETCNSKHVLSRRTMQRTSLEPFDRAGHITCLHLDNVASLKSLRSGPKHQLDRAVIRNGPDAAHEWFETAAPAEALMAQGGW